MATYVKKCIEGKLFKKLYLHSRLSLIHLKEENSPMVKVEMCESQAEDHYKKYCDEVFKTV